MLSMLLRLTAALVAINAFGVNLVTGAPVAQLDSGVRHRVLPAAVQIAIMVETTENASTRSEYLPLGSGTVVSPDGLILTNWHVVDMTATRKQLDAWEAQAAADGGSLQFDLDDTQVLVLRTEGASPPQPVFRAHTVGENHALDLAVLQVTADAYGSPLDPTALDVPFVPLGDSDAVLQGDLIHVFGYPAIGGGTLQYTSGVVSGFGYDESITGPAWITTNATMSGGSSGGTAVDDAGRLIGVPTQGSQLDCRPGDTNRDVRRVDAADVGCIPVGGSFGELRPINLARDLLAHAGLDPAPSGGGAVPSTGVVISDTPTGGIVLPDDVIVFPEEQAYCKPSPVYPAGTELVLPRPATVWVPRFGAIVPDKRYSTLTAQFVAADELSAGTVVEITGPFVEDGVCDVWPVHYDVAGVASEGYIDEQAFMPVT